MRQKKNRPINVDMSPLTRIGIYCWTWSGDPAQPPIRASTRWCCHCRSHQSPGSCSVPTYLGSPTPTTSPSPRCWASCRPGSPRKSTTPTNSPSTTCSLPRPPTRCPRSLVLPEQPRNTSPAPCRHSARPTPADRSAPPPHAAAARRGVTEPVPVHLPVHLKLCTRHGIWLSDTGQPNLDVTACPEIITGQHRANRLLRRYTPQQVVLAHEVALAAIPPWPATPADIPLH